MIGAERGVTDPEVIEGLEPITLLATILKV